MDDDLIKRLQARCVYGDARLLMWSKHDPLSAEAAAEIYRLRAENERLTKERDEALAERDALMADPLYIIGVNHGWDEAVENDAAHPAARPIQSMLADAERDMRQRAADLVGQEARTFPDNVAWGVEDLAKAILALPLKHADREEGV